MASFVLARLVLPQSWHVSLVSHQFFVLSSPTALIAAHFVSSGGWFALFPGAFISHR
jgi:hypothetical protein